MSEIIKIPFSPFSHKVILILITCLLHNFFSSYFYGYLFFPSGWDGEKDKGLRFKPFYKLSISVCKVICQFKTFNFHRNCTGLSVNFALSNWQIYKKAKLFYPQPLTSQQYRAAGHAFIFEMKRVVTLTLNLLNYLNQIIHLPFLLLSIIIFRGY